MPEYKGCHKDDHMDRDFLHLIGTDLEVKDCFDKAKNKGYSYVGLQNGKECWGGNTYGKHGAAPEFECKHLCVKDKEKTCGGDSVSSIWDISSYTGIYSVMPLCNATPFEPTDCSKRGGYDNNDLCMETCIKTDEEIIPAEE